MRLTRSQARIEGMTMIVNAFRGTRETAAHFIPQGPLEIDDGTATLVLVINTDTLMIHTLTVADIEEIGRTCMMQAQAIRDAKDNRPTLENMVAAEPGTLLASGRVTKEATRIPAGE